ncbi:hypothetical protein [Jeotgalibacillus soli]|uniref:Flagellar protein FliT n=1 Tax=Jeotgalibacillus soli TaxID=889306 RepID=A0A0C2VM09_9BACL|nr:hypothetical protein [Jeotgalibacillus soli]KIL49947.1 hypothetical protein KP78_14150 [Jeotgalibacillus soli]
MHQQFLYYANDEAQSAKREDVIARIDRFHQARELLLKKLNPPKTDEEHTIVKRIFQLNETITHFIQQSFNDVKKDIQLQNKKKKHTNQYSDPYARHRGTDGAFYDKRK